MATEIDSRPPAAVIEVNEQTFQREVLARSREIPVVVDFWAPWCGPCRALGPTLEKLAGEARGAFVLAKINVDENPSLAQLFQVQGIPAVKAFRDGRVVDAFTGALPEGQVRAWLKRVVPSEADALAAAAQALEASDPEAAIARYRLALGAEPDNAAALFGLGRLLTLRGDPEGAQLLAEVPARSPFFARAQALGELHELLAAADSTDGGESAARFAQAGQALRAGRYAEALDQLLQLVQADRAFGNDAARRAMLAIFALLGDNDPLVGEYRRRLANALF
jgi:putative thioredoxin